MSDPKIPDDIKAMKFEDALAELETIVKKLETGDAKLDDAINAYERGAALKKHCESKLAEAQARIERIAGSVGDVKTEPAELD